MKKIFASEEIEVLSLEGLNYTTNFDHVVKGSSHLPVFSKDQEMYYVHMGEEIRSFVIHKVQYGFRYYDDNGEQSPLWTAIFCQLEGEDSECVILGRYYQNSDADYLDSCWEIPYGIYHPRSSYPKVFYRSKEDFVNMRNCVPSLYRVSPDFVAYKYDAIQHKAVALPIQVDEYYRTRTGELHVVKSIIDDKVWFNSEHACEVYHRQRIVEEAQNAED